MLDWKKNILFFLARQTWMISIPYKIKDILQLLKDKYNVETIVVFIDKEKKKISKDKLLKQKELSDIWIIFKRFNTEKDLLDYSKSLNNNNNNNIWVYTYNDMLSILAFKIKNILWQKINDDISLFADKKVQREMLLKYNKDITVNYLKFNDIKKINIHKILNNFKFPFMIKPSSWSSSTWVYKINNNKEFEKAIKTLNIIMNDRIKNNKSYNEKIIIEEYIDGKMYTIDYFVNEKQKIYLTKPVRTYTLQDEYNIDDFWITKEILWRKIEKEIDQKQLEKFVEDNIKACWIRNTFVHHEFKLTSKWQLKTIELNWRIGGFRTNMYKNAYGLLPLEFLFNKKIKSKFKQYYMFIWLFPIEEKDLIYKWLKKTFINNIKKLPSFLNINIKKTMIGQKIWFTKNWYKFFWTIELVNKDYDQLKDDYNFIKNNLQSNILYINE